MDHFVIWVKQHSGWLYVQIYENQFFFIDFWSLTHLWSGFVLFSVILAYTYRHPWRWLVIYLSIYEIVEISMLYLSLHAFQPETIKDQLTDIIIGILGGVLSYFFVRQKAKRRFAFFDKLDIEALFVAETMSFLWIDRSQFFFFLPEPNPLSVLNYLWRILLGYLIIRIYATSKLNNKRVLNGLLVFAMAYFSLFILSGFLLGNYNFKMLFEMKIIGESVLFNLSYFIYQLSYPFITILFYEWIHHIFEKGAHEFTLKENLSYLTKAARYVGVFKEQSRTVS